MVSSRKWESTTFLIFIALLPLVAIALAIVAWLIIGAVWLVTLLINVVTIMIGSFVIIPIEWLFLLSDWILSWLGPIIGGYFTQSHFFNWLNNLYLLIGLVVLGVVLDAGGINISEMQKSSLIESSKKSTQNAGNSIKSGDLEVGQYQTTGN